MNLIELAPNGHWQDSQLINKDNGRDATNIELDGSSADTGESATSFFTILSALIQKIFIFVIFVFFLLLLTATSGHAQPLIEDCSPALNIRLNQAKDYLIEIQQTLADDFEINARRSGQERRAARQILRRVEKLSFICKSDPDCDTHTAIAGTIVGGNRIRICENILPPTTTFCRLVSFVAHEFGHNAHVPRARLGEHNRRSHSDPDKVYQFGYFAGERCVADFSRTFRLSDAGPPNRLTTSPTGDLSLFQDPNFGGTSQEIFSASPTAANVVGRQYLPDLRYAGADDSVSSIRIRSGYWELCSEKNFTGACIYADRDIPNLQSVGMSDKISSVRYLGATQPSRGLLLFVDPNFRGGEKFSETGFFNVYDTPGFDGGISSAQVRTGGLIEGCILSGRSTTWCLQMAGDIPDLRTQRADNQLITFAPVRSRLPRGLTIYSEDNFRGLSRYYEAGSRTNAGAFPAGVDNRIKSLHTNGSWRICTESGGRGRCEIISGCITEARLRDLGLAGNISSAYPDGATRTDRTNEILTARSNERGRSRVPLYSWYNSQRGDNFLTSNPEWNGGDDLTHHFQCNEEITAQPEKASYRMYRIEGTIFSPRAARIAGTVPLFSWYNPERGDNFATTDPRWAIDPARIVWNGEQIAESSRPPNRDGYRLYRLEGYIYDPKRPQPANTIPLYSWYNAARGDNLATTKPDWITDSASIIWNGESLAERSRLPNRDGYGMYRLEGYIQKRIEP